MTTSITAAQRARGPGKNCHRSRDTVGQAKGAAQCRRRLDHKSRSVGACTATRRRKPRLNRTARRAGACTQGPEGQRADTVEASGATNIAPLRRHSKGITRPKAQEKQGQTQPGGVGAAKPLCGKGVPFLRRQSLVEPKAGRWPKLGEPSRVIGHIQAGRRKPIGKEKPKANLKSSGAAQGVA